MATTFNKIATVDVGSGGAASISFTSIPQTYTDLILVLSLRSNRSGVNNDIASIRFNGSSTGYTLKKFYGTGSSVGSDPDTNNDFYAVAAGASAPAATFGNSSVYITNYTSSNAKSISLDAVAGNDTTSTFMEIQSALWNNPASITSMLIYPGAGGTAWNQYSTASLYGILKGSGGATVA